MFEVKVTFPCGFQKFFSVEDLQYRLHGLKHNGQRPVKAHLYLEEGYDEAHRSAFVDKYLRRAMHPRNQVITFSFKKGAMRSEDKEPRSERSE